MSYFDEKNKNLELTIMLLAGIRPRYKAFSYMMYLICECQPDEILGMKTSDILNLISDKFGVATDQANSNFKALIKGCAYSYGKKSPIISFFPDADFELPSPCEFVTAAICYMRLMKLLHKDELGDDSLLNSIHNSSVNNSVYNI